MEKPRKLNTRQYVGLVRDLKSRMAQLPPLFQKSQKLDESELVDSLVNKAPRSHKAMLVSQGFNPENQHSLVGPWRLVGERVDQLRLVEFLTVLK